MAFRHSLGAIIRCDILTARPHKSRRPSARKSDISAGPDEVLAARLDYRFRRPELLQQALRHASATRPENSNEKLEFLGDRVLALVIADYLYQTFPREREGDWAKRLNMLVSRSVCARVANAYHFQDVLNFSANSNRRKPSQNMLADSCEAVIAALYMDGGMEIARRFILQAWQPIFLENTAIPYNAKSELQELTVARGLGMPEYELVSMEGPAHRPIITVTVRLVDGSCATAQAKLRKEAELAAAQDLLTQLDERYHD